jgi:hypothetical protein
MKVAPKDPNPGNANFPIYREIVQLKITNMMQWKEIVLYEYKSTSM